MNIKASIVWSLNLIEGYGLAEPMNMIPSGPAYIIRTLLACMAIAKA